MFSQITGKEIEFDWGADPMRERAFKYMKQIAERDGYEIDLRPTHANKDLLLAVLEWCDHAVARQREREESPFVVFDDEQDIEQLKRLCDQLAYQSRLGELQGVYHQEPDDLEEYDRLFNTVHGGRLDLHDVVYSKAPTRQIEIVYNLAADDESVLRMTPNVQLSFWDLPAFNEIAESIVPEDERVPDREIEVV
jgi:hypothetical protein